MSNRLKAGLDKAFAPLLSWAMSKTPAQFARTDAEVEPPRRNERNAMVTAQIAARGVRDPDVLSVMRHVPRHEFVPQAIADHAYDDSAMPIGEGQTISQPYIVGLMTEALQLTKDCRVLEIGTGCGYQSAILAALCKQVYSVEIVAALAEETRQRLARLGIGNVEILVGDGYRGWPEAAPFDRIIVTAAPNHLPEHLFSQLSNDGKLIIPVGEKTQDLMVFTMKEEQIEAKRLIPVRFVPMTGEALMPRVTGGNPDK